MFVVYAQMPVINVHVDVSSEARGLIISLSLHPDQYFMYSSSDYSGESAHMRRLAV